MVCIFLYCIRAFDLTMLQALSNISSNQAKPTLQTKVSTNNSSNTNMILIDSSKIAPLQPQHKHVGKNLKTLPPSTLLPCLMLKAKNSFSKWFLSSYIVVDLLTQQ